MNIGIDFTSSSQRAGIGRYTWALVSALAALPHADEITLVMPRSAHRRGQRLLSPKVRYRLLPLTERALTRIWHRLRLPLYADLVAGGVDVFYAPDFALPPLWRAPGVFTVHDLSYLHEPESYPASLRAHLHRIVPRSLARARLALADSLATKQDLLAAYGARPEQVEVVYCGVEPVFQRRCGSATLRERFGISYPYFLSVGTIQPRKNIARIIAAMAAVAQAGLPHHLVHVGRPGWLHGPILAAPQSHGVADRVHFLTDVETDEDLAALYSGACALVFPSLYEGFGLPVLEAMACGTPVLTANVSSLPEVAGDAAILVDPADVGAIAEGMVRLAGDERTRAALSAAGRDRVAQFSWEQAAGQVREQLARAAQL